MVVTCHKCNKVFDDNNRSYVCPHEKLFPAVVDLIPYLICLIIILISW